jgi:hypothetical protein
MYERPEVENETRNAVYQLQTISIEYIVEYAGPPHPAAAERIVGYECGSTRTIPTGTRYERADLLNLLRGLPNLPQDIKADIKVTNENGVEASQFEIKSGGTRDVVDSGLRESKPVIARVQGALAHSTELLICSD